MFQKQLLSFEDVGEALECTTHAVRLLVVEERSLPAIVVTLDGERKGPYGAQKVESIGDDGSVLVLHDNPRRLDRGDRGYLRVERSALDTFMTERSIDRGRVLAVNEQRDPMVAATDGQGIDDDFDPSDLPDELDCANQAYRAVSIGYGDGYDTFRNRLLAWLAEHRPELGTEARERIATVANPDKAAGRKARKRK